MSRNMIGAQQAKAHERMQQMQGQIMAMEMEMRHRVLVLSKEVLDRAGALSDEKPEKVIEFADKLMNYVRTGKVMEAPKPPIIPSDLIATDKPE
jgi:adenine deaminase